MERQLVEVEVARPMAKRPRWPDSTPHYIHVSISMIQSATMPPVHKFALVVLTLLSASGQGTSFVPATSTTADSHHAVGRRAASRLEFQSDGNNYA